MKPVGTGAPRPISAPAQVATPEDVQQPAEERALQEPDAPVATERAALGGGLPPATLAHHLDAASRVFDELAARPLPGDVHELATNYRELGGALARAEACLLSALDALDPLTGDGRAEPAAPFEALKQRGFQALRRAGEVFALLEPGFKQHVHGPGGWPPRPVEVAPDRGDGRPLYHYENTFKLSGDLTLDEKIAEYQERVDGYREEGGEVSALALTTAEDIAAMRHNVRYDYAMLADGERMRMVPRTGPGASDPGHSLLAVGDDEYVDEPLLLAGEIWVLRDMAGDVEAVVVANNSGHFKPEYEDLQNAVPVLEKLGVPAEKIVLFGGPNNLPAMFDEMAERAGLPDPAEHLPKGARALLAEWAAAPPLSPLSVRF